MSLLTVVRRLLVVVCCLALAVPAAGQTLASSSLTTNGQSVSATLGTDNLVSVSIQITGTWTGTITFEGSVDGSTYVSVLASNITTGASASSTTANAVFSFTNSGYRIVRASATAAMTGTAVVTLAQGYAGGGGGGASGSVTQGTSPWVVGDGAGALNVICDSGCSGGVQYTQDAALTVATTVGTMAMGRASAAAPTDVSADNDAVIPWYLRSGALASQVTFGGVLASTGNGVSGTGVQRVTIASDSTGAFSGLLANDGVAAGTNRLATLPGITENAAPTRTDGRNAALSLTTGGAARVMITNAAGAAQTIASDQTFGTSTYTEATTTGPLVGAVRTDSPVALANTTNEIAPLSVSALGALYTASASDPCSRIAKSYYVVNTTTAATFEIANAVASQFIYVCSVNLVAAGAQAVLIAHDDTDACVSITAGMNGGVTAATGWNFAANGGISLGTGDSAIMKAATANHYFCLLTSTTAQLSGTIAYVFAP